MFIYIKQCAKGAGRRPVISRIDDECGFYYEVLFGGVPSSRACRRAVRKCDKSGRLPIVCRSLSPCPRGCDRLLSVKEFDMLLAANAFSLAIRGLSSALIADPYGRLCELAVRPLISVQTLYIYTERPDIYLEFNDRCMKRLGTCAILITSIPSTEDFPAVLSADETVRHPFLFGTGGFMPHGDTILLRGQRLERELCAARWLCLKDAKMLDCKPELIAYKEGEAITPWELKTRLDRRFNLGL